MALTNYGNWGGCQIVRPLMPAAGETVNGEWFPVPPMSKVMTIYCPDLVGAATTLKVQSLDPREDVTYGTPAWRDVSTFNLAGGAPVALISIPESGATTVPTTATGGGVLRLVASADQSSTPVKIDILFLMD